MSNPDPCHLFADAVAESEAQIQSLLQQLDAALDLYDERLEGLADCRDRNPGSGGGPVGALRWIRGAVPAVKRGWAQGAKLVVNSWREAF